jgi:hypothetical protein
MRISNLGAVAVVLVTTLPALAQTSGAISDTGARPGNEIGTGNSLPRSDKASNINQSDSPSKVAPNLPTPALGENSGPRDYLIAARNSLAAGKTGMAQQSLEMAQTRLLDRSVRPSQTSDPSQDPRVKRIEDARQALGNGDKALAMQIIDSALGQ